MGPLSSVTTPNSSITTPLRDNNGGREDTVVQERLQSTKPSGSSMAKSDNSSAKNYRQSQDFSDARVPDPSALQGNRRGSLLDLTV